MDTGCLAIVCWFARRSFEKPSAKNNENDEASFGIAAGVLTAVHAGPATEARRRLRRAKMETPPSCKRSELF